jgi:hypothetical protein
MGFHRPTFAFLWGYGKASTMHVGLELLVRELLVRGGTPLTIVLPTLRVTSCCPKPECSTIHLIKPLLLSS